MFELHSEGGTSLPSFCSSHKQAPYFHPELEGLEAAGWAARNDGFEEHGDGMLEEQDSGLEEGVG